MVVPVHVPEVMVPTEVSEEAVTPEPSVVALRTDRPPIWNALPLVRLRVPLKSPPPATPSVAAGDDVPMPNEPPLVMIPFANVLVADVPEMLRYVALIPPNVDVASVDVMAMGEAKVARPFLSKASAAVVDVAVAVEVAK